MNNGRKGGHFKFDQVNFFQDASSSEISHFELGQVEFFQNASSPEALQFVL